MSIQEQKELEKLITDYNSTDPTIVKQNILKYIDLSGLRIKHIADNIGVTMPCICSYRQPAKRHAIAFDIAVKLANVLNINITQLIEQY